MKLISEKINNLSRLNKSLILLCLDIVLILLVIILAFSIRFGEIYWPKNDLLWFIFIAPVIAIPIFTYFGFYRSIIRFVGLDNLWSIIKAVSIYAFIWIMFAFMMKIEGIPRSVVILNWLLAVAAISGSRMFIRWFFVQLEFLKYESKIKKVLIYGAGSAGRQLSIAIAQSSELLQIGFIDDDDKLVNKSINNLQIFSVDDLEKLIPQKKINEVLIALPSISARRRKKVIEKLEPYPIAVRSLPSIKDIAGGKIKIDDLLEIDITDLLGREVVKPNKELLEININSKVVMITGAGGSIGSELCRQILSHKPKKIVLFDLSESSLYLIEQELINLNHRNIKIISLIGSVIDQKLIKKILNDHYVQTIYHAAAYKHVPLVESNPYQGVLNNTFGTMSLSQAAIEANIETFVFISTDKAVRPTSIMGASKRIGELILQANSSSQSKTCFSVVRFGNVIDSSGSVIPLFRKQIQKGGPITVTHENIVRFFMTIPEAVELVIQAGAMAKGGEVFVLDMGEPIKISDLAKKMVNLSGLKVLDKDNLDGDIEIQYTGLRPGEKLFEELLIDGNYSLTENKLIMCAKEELVSWDKIEKNLGEIKIAAEEYNYDKLKVLISRILPEFNSTE